MKTAAELYREREQRISDALALKEPDRVPIVPSFAFFAAHYAGITVQEAMYDADKMEKAWVKTTLDFQPDGAENPYPRTLMGKLLDDLDYKGYKWPGHGLGPNHTFQYVEGEYMMADEYDEFLKDTSNFLMRKYWPRVFGNLSGFKNMPAAHFIIQPSDLTTFAGYSAEDVLKSIDALKESALEAARMMKGFADYNVKLKEMGFPLLFGGSSQAPFDTLSDYLRGTKGAMVDMYRQPANLLAALEKILPINYQKAVAACQKTGIPRVFIPLHKGQEYFLSIEQFKKFYWPSLRKLMLMFIDAGLNPCPLIEGDYTSRLELIGDMPKGKCIYHFEVVDMAKAKRLLGKEVCIRGNVPLSLLCMGTQQEVSDYCRRLIETVGKDGGYIMDAASNLEEAKPENVRAMFETTLKYGVYR